MSYYERDRQRLNENKKEKKIKKQKKKIKKEKVLHQIEKKQFDILKMLSVKLDEIKKLDFSQSAEKLKYDLQVREDNLAFEMKKLALGRQENDIRDRELSFDKREEEIGLNMENFEILKRKVSQSISELKNLLPYKTDHQKYLWEVIHGKYDGIDL